MQARHEDFRRLGADVVAVSSSSVEKHRKLAEKLVSSSPNAVPLTLLSDTEGSVFRDYGVLHPGALPFDDGPVARPAIFLIDGEGRIRGRYVTENWRVRERPERLLAELRKLQENP